MVAQLVHPAVAVERWVPVGDLVVVPVHVVPALVAVGVAVGVDGVEVGSIVVDG